MPTEVQEVEEHFTVIREEPDKITVREPVSGEIIVVRDVTARGPAGTPGATGPQGPQGITGPIGPQGEPGENTVSYYRHVQGVPSSVWEVNHNLGYYPGGIVVRDSSGGLHEGLVEYLDINNITISFFVAGLPASFSGEADIS